VGIIRSGSRAVGARLSPFAEFLLLTLTCRTERLGIFQPSGDRPLHDIRAMHGDVTICFRRGLETINDITPRNPALTYVGRDRFCGGVKRIKVVRVRVCEGAHDLV